MPPAPIPRAEYERPRAQPRDSLGELPRQAMTQEEGRSLLTQYQHDLDIARRDFEHNSRRVNALLERDMRRLRLHDSEQAQPTQASIESARLQWQRRFEAPSDSGPSAAIPFDPSPPTLGIHSWATWRNPGHGHLPVVWVSQRVPVEDPEIPTNRTVYNPEGNYLAIQYPDSVGEAERIIPAENTLPNLRASSSREVPQAQTLQVPRLPNYTALSAGADQRSSLHLTRSSDRWDGSNAAASIRARNPDSNNSNMRMNMPSRTDQQPPNSSSQTTNNRIENRSPVPEVSLPTEFDPHEDYRFSPMRSYGRHHLSPTVRPPPPDQDSPTGTSRAQSPTAYRHNINDIPPDEDVMTRHRQAGGRRLFGRTLTLIDSFDEADLEAIERSADISSEDASDADVREALLRSADETSGAQPRAFPGFVGSQPAQGSLARPAADEAASAGSDADREFRERAIARQKRLQEGLAAQRAARATPTEASDAGLRLYFDDVPTSSVKQSDTATAMYDSQLSHTDMPTDKTIGQTGDESGWETSWDAVLDRIKCPEQHQHAPPVTCMFCDNELVIKGLQEQDASGSREPSEMLGCCRRVFGKKCLEAWFLQSEDPYSESMAPQACCPCCRAGWKKIEKYDAREGTSSLWSMVMSDAERQTLEQRDLDLDFS